MQLFGSRRNGKHKGSSAASPESGAGDPIDSIRTDSIDSTVGEETASAAVAEKPPVKGKKPGRSHKTLFIVLGVVAALLIALFAAYKLFVKPPKVVDDGPTAATGSDIKDPEENAPATESGRRDGVYTFLLVGLDRVGNNTDTIMVGCLDTVKGTVNVVSIPRDTLVDTAYRVKKINNIYPVSINNGGNGIDDLMAAVKDLVGFSIDSYAVIDLEACAKIVDIIGGVTFDVPVKMYYDDPAQDLHIAIPAGTQTLSGDNFVKVMRFRHTYAGGDIQRIGVQHDLLMALAKQTLTAGNIKNIDKLIDVYEQYVDTNLTSNNLAFYLEQFLKLKPENITFSTIPNNAMMLCSLSYVMVDIDKWIPMINEKLNPYAEKITPANLDVISFDKKNFISTTGSMKGGATSFHNFNLGYTPQIITYKEADSNA